jgi:hypothetical protein
MTDHTDTTPEKRDDVSEVPREEWPSWAAKATSDHVGREVVLHQADRALGEVRLAAGQSLVAIEHDEFGRTEALTIKCGSSAVPVSYVIAEPRSIRQHHDEAGDIDELSIVDATGRRTLVSFA